MWNRIEDTIGTGVFAMCFLFEFLGDCLLFLFFSPMLILMLGIALIVGSICKLFGIKVEN